jgi:hypothetical protein
MSLDGRQGEVTNGRFVGFHSTKAEFSRMAGEVVGPQPVLKSHSS